MGCMFGESLNGSGIDTVYNCCSADVSPYIVASSSGKGVMARPHKGNTLVKTLYGKVSVLDHEHDLISRSLCVHGEWAYTETQLLAPLIQPGDVVWDVGAFLGTFGLGLAQLAHPSRLVAVEANPAILPLLDSNLAANAPCPFEVVHAAVGAPEGRMRPVENSSVENQGATRFEYADDAVNNGCVDSISLRDLRALHGNYDVLKLDIEGMELDALLGDFEYLRDKKPVIWVECNEDVACLRLFSVLKQLGYEPMYVAFPAFRRANFNCSEERIFPMAYEAAILAAPAERLALFSASLSQEECIVRPLATQADLRSALWDTPRWAMQDWAELSKPELVARLGRQSRGEKLGTFLSGKDTQISTVNPVQISSELELTLYWAQGEKNVVGYAEEHSTRTKYMLDGSPHLLNVKFPALSEPIRKLRLDVSDAPVALALKTLSLHDANNHEIWRWNGRSDAFENFRGVVCWQGSGEGGLVMLCLNDDPQFEIIIPQELLAQVSGGSVMRVEMTTQPLHEQQPVVFAQMQMYAAVSHGPVGVSRYLEDLAELIEVQLARKNETIIAQRAEIDLLRKQALLCSQIFRAETQIDLLKEIVSLKLGKNT